VTNHDDKEDSQEAGTEETWQVVLGKRNGGPYPLKSSLGGGSRFFP